MVEHICDIKVNLGFSTIKDLTALVWFHIQWQLVLQVHTLLSLILRQALPVFTFANQAGLYMLVTTLVALQDITLDKMFDDHGKKNLCIEFPQTMQQVGTPFMWKKFNIEMLLQWANLNHGKLMKKQLKYKQVLKRRQTLTR